MKVKELMSYLNYRDQNADVKIASTNWEPVGTGLYIKRAFDVVDTNCLSPDDETVFIMADI